MDECIFCGSKENPTREHIIPKRIFIGGNFSNLIILPSCKICNSYYAKYEEVFFTKVVITSCHKEEIIQKVKRSLNREEAIGFGETIRKSFVYKEIGGDKRLSTDIEEDDIKNMLGKFFQGLYFHEFKEKPNLGETHVLMFREDNENMTDMQLEFLEIFNGIKGFLIKGKSDFPGYFSYEFIREENITFFKFTFYNDVTFGYFNIN